MRRRSPQPRSRSRALAAAAVAGCLGAAASAEATWSIILVDTRTGEVAIGSATCLTGFDLRAGTPVLIPGVGGATAQSFVDSTGQNRVVIRDELILGTDPDEVLDVLAAFDVGHQTRQYGIVDAYGRAATFTGGGAGPWAGGQVGRVGDIAYAVQGNVLTGEPVVTQAVQAIIATPGDLADKLMASMEAARLMGGDGRCSCNPNDADGCGAPPPSFTKSAHIAYMLIARTGDRAGCNGIYRAGGPRGVALADLDADGRPEVIAAGGNSGDIVVLPNITPERSAFPVFGPRVNTAVGNGPRSVAVADFNGDGAPDAASANLAADTVAVALNSGGSLGSAAVYAAGDGPSAIVAADFDGINGPDLAAANSLSGTVTVLLNNGQGAFTAAAPVPAFAAAPALAAADLDGDGDTDLAVAGGNANAVVLLLNNGDGSFERGAELATGTNPLAVVAFDADGDGDADLAVHNAGSGTIQVFINASGPFAPTTFPAPVCADLAAADVDADGRQDLVGACGAELVVFRGLGKGLFGPGAGFQLNANAHNLTLGDLDGDGLPEAVLGAAGVVVVQNLGGGAFNSGVGCATGDYYMNFNVANQSAGAPDPVFQLKDLFAAWKADLDGRPDAVLSVVAVDPPRLIAGQGGTATVTVELRDRDGDPITAAIGSVVAEHAPESGGQSLIGPVTDLGAGRYRFEVTAAPVPERARIRVTADDGVRPVVLMPDALVRVTADPDFDGDGDVDGDDLAAFRTAYLAGEARADLNGDGVLTVADFVAMLEATRE